MLHGAGHAKFIAALCLLRTVFIAALGPRSHTGARGAIAIQAFCESSR